MTTPVLNLRDGACGLAPGCYDRITVNLAAGAGCVAAYLGPFGMLSALFGGRPPTTWSFPPYVEHIRTIAQDSPIPLIVDGHVGVESGVPVGDVVQALSAAGAAAVAIEDRSEFWAPIEGLQSFLVRDDVRRHIATALAARTSDDVRLIVRTDAARFSLDEALRRCEWFLEDGASLVMPLLSPFMSYSHREVSYGERLAVHRRVVEVLGRTVVTHSPLGRDLTLDDATLLGYPLYVIPQLALSLTMPALRSGFAALTAGSIEEHLAHVQEVHGRPLARALGVEQWLVRRLVIPNIPRPGKCRT